jgi:hypothetical protein
MNQHALNLPLHDAAHSAEETCPYCEQAIPNERADEIRARFAARREQEEAALKADMERQLASKAAEIEQGKKAEIAQLVSAQAAELQKFKDAAANDLALAREEGEQIATEAAEERIQTLVAEKEASDQQLLAVKEQKSAVEAQVQKLSAEREETIATRTAEVRAAMEKAQAEALNAQTAKHAEETTQLSAQIAALQKQVSGEAGEGADIILLDQLRTKFPKDEISKINKPTGADIRHIVKHNKKVCGIILYDSRNHGGWRASYATDLQRDMVTEKADHAIMTTMKFPAGHKQLCATDGVIVTHLPRVAVLAEIFREQIVRYHSQRLSEEDKSHKTAELYAYITSDNFSKFMKSMEGNDAKLLKLEEEEKTEHTKTWNKRGQLLTENQRLHGKLRSEIDRITGASD